MGVGDKDILGVTFLIYLVSTAFYSKNKKIFRRLEIDCKNTSPTTTPFHIRIFQADAFNYIRFALNYAHKGGAV